LPACGIAIGKPLGSVPHLGRLEPDLIGEFFALETLRGDPNNPFAEPPHTWMPKAAWRASGSGMFDFVARAKQTFPDYPAIQQVDITVEGVSESWLLAAFAILARADNLTVGFGDVQKWLRPHAQSDASAARAFANFALTFANRAYFGTLLDSVVSPVRVALLDDLRVLVRTHRNDVTVRQALALSLIELLKLRSGGAFDRREVLDELRAVARNYPDDATVRDKLASGLLRSLRDAFWKGDFDRHDALLDELRVHARGYLNTADRAKWPDCFWVPKVHASLTRGLCKTLIDAVVKGDHDRAFALAAELDALTGDYPETIDICKRLAGDLVNTLNGDALAVVRDLLLKLQNS
jgi:hypothetical protein